MPAQPLNTTISVFPALRSFRAAHRHESVAALIKHLRRLVMSIPAEEILVVYETRDTDVTDMSPFMGEARHTATRGFPIVVGLRDQVSIGNAQTNITGIDFAYKVGSDLFLRQVSGSLSRDLHDDARDLSDDIDQGAW